MDNEQTRTRYHDEAWQRFMEAERRHLEDRRTGHLARLLGGPLPGESAEELQLLTAEDQRRADEGLVELGSPRGEVSYKHIDELTPEDRQARAEAERVLMSWIIERQRGRRPHPVGSRAVCSDIDPSPSLAGSHHLGIAVSLRFILEAWRHRDGSTALAGAIGQGSH